MGDTAPAWLSVSLWRLVWALVLWAFSLLQGGMVGSSWLLCGSMDTPVAERATGLVGTLDSVCRTLVAGLARWG